MTRKRLGTAAMPRFVWTNAKGGDPNERRYTHPLFSTTVIFSIFLFVKLKTAKLRLSLEKVRESNDGEEKSHIPDWTDHKEKKHGIRV